MKRLIDGALVGTGFLAVIALAFAVAWAGDVFTIDPSERTNLFVRAGKDGAVKFAVSDAGKITVGATESYVNLVVQNNVGTSTNKVDITADVLTVEGVRLEGLNVSADVTAAVGAGGRDTNFADAANTWYYIWVITNNDGTLSNAILTLAPATPNPPTPPVLPSGYTKKRRVGAVRNNASSNFLPFVQEGNKVLYPSVVGANRIVNGGKDTAWTLRSAAGFIPPTSRRGFFHVETFADPDAANAAYDVMIRKPGVGPDYSVQNACRSQVLGVVINSSTMGDADTDTSQNIEYKMYSAPTGVGGAFIAVLGYYDRI